MESMPQDKVVMATTKDLARDHATADIESNASSRSNNARPACFKSTFQEVLFVLTTTMAIAMSSIIGGSISVVSSFIGRDLNMTTAEITWITSSISLGSGAFLLFFGRTADLFGRKLMFVTSLFLFAIVCLGTGFSQNAITVDILGGIAGLCSAAAVPPAVGLLGVIYEKLSIRKNAVFACFSAGNPLGYVFGTIFGGIATEIFDWRASFWLLAIIFLVVSIVAVFTVPADFTEKAPLSWETVKRFDIVGTLLTIAGISLFSAGLTLGGTAPDGWSTSYVIATLILGVVLMAVFVVWELYYPHPLVPMSIWRNRDFSLLMAIMTMGFMAFVPAAFFVALFFQEVWHMSALDVAVHLLPCAINGLLVNVVAGIVLHRVSNKLLMYIAAAAYAVAILLLAVNHASVSYWALCFPGLTILVVGADLEFNIANMYVMSSMPPSQQSIAGGIFQTAAKLCSTIGFGIATAIFNGLQEKPTLSRYWDVATQPYAGVFWMGFALSAASILLVPFLTIGTQGGMAKETETDQVADSPAVEKNSDREKAIAEAMLAQALPTKG